VIERYGLLNVRETLVVVWRAWRRW